MTFNIRFDSGGAYKTMPYPPSGPNQTFPHSYYGEYAWKFRRYAVSDTILMHNPDVIFMQEVLYNQLQDLAFLLGEEYDFVGVGRDDGNRRGEAVPVFWKKNKLALVPENQGGVGKVGVEHFWLSPTPEKVASVGWDAALTRMCTHLSLRLINPPSSSPSDLSLHAPMHIFSTHYDHMGHLARAESSKLIVKRADAARKRIQQLWKDMAAAEGSKLAVEVEPLIILAGDLNSPREERGWQNLVKGHYGVPSDKDASLSFFDLQLSVPTRFGLSFPTDHFPLTEEDPYLHEWTPEIGPDGNTIRPKTPSSDLREAQLAVAAAQSQEHADFSLEWPGFDSRSMRPANELALQQQQRLRWDAGNGGARTRIEADRGHKRSIEDVVRTNEADDLAKRQSSTTPPRPRRGILSTAFGPPASFTDWTPIRDRSPSEDRIDFIFVGDNHNLILEEGQARSSSSTTGKSVQPAGWRLKTAGVLSNRDRGEGGILISDHRPVLARLQWES